MDVIVEKSPGAAKAAPQQKTKGIQGDQLIDLVSVLQRHQHHGSHRSSKSREVKPRRKAA